MQPDRPPKLTLTVVERGFRYIEVDGARAGLVWMVYPDGWEALLWATPGFNDRGAAGKVKRHRLRDLREELARKLASEGPWWDARRYPPAGRDSVTMDR